VVSTCDVVPLKNDGPPSGRYFVDAESVALEPTGHLRQIGLGDAEAVAEFFRRRPLSIIGRGRIVLRLKERVRLLRGERVTIAAQTHTLLIVDISSDANLGEHSRQAQQENGK
jgi:hypothetical protein